MTWQEGLSLIITAISLIRFLRALGQQITLVHAIGLITCIIYLAMPVLAFNVFNKYNDLAKLYQTIMPLPSKDYFDYALPATMSLLIGLNWPVRRKNLISDHQLLTNTQSYLKGKYVLGYIFIAIGLLSGFLLQFLPEAFIAIANFGNLLFFVGIFYLLFSPIRYKPVVLLIAILALFIQAIGTGMYGELIFWSFLLTMYLLMKVDKMHLGAKVLLVVLGVIFIMFIQSIKHEYRERTWAKNEQDGDAVYFWSLIVERIKKPSVIFEANRLHAMATRGNQGFLLARTMDYVPRKEPFANGETILISVKASLVPRIFWKDKPRLGGLENTCRFLGDCSKRSYSYNIGQLGEAYVNFGKMGGALFMFLYGYFIHWMIEKARRLSIRYPTLILWIPLLFYSSLTMESDVLTFLNSFVKGSLFCIIVYFMFRYLLGWRI